METEEEYAGILPEVCRTHRDVKNAEQVIMKDGRPSIRGECEVCGRKVSGIGKLAEVSV